MTDPTGQTQPPFAERLSELVTLLRRAQGDSADSAGALSSALEALRLGGVTLVAGFEQSWGMDQDSLKARLLARGVDTVRLEANVLAEDLLAFARALASDELPFVEAPGIRVELIPGVGSSGEAPAPGHFPFETTPAPVSRPVLRTSADAAHTLETLVGETATALERGNTLQALHDVQAIIRMLPAVPEDSRRGFAIVVRRQLTRAVAEQFIQLAFRVPEEQRRVTEVLRWAGLDAAELMLELIRQSEAVGPRGFLFDALGGMPEALPIIVPLLASDRWYEVRHAADLLGRIGAADAIDLLKARINHPDERVRLAVIDSLARFREKAVVEILRQALSHRSARTRGHAGRAMGRRGSSALAMPLLAALDSEKDPVAWRELLGALAQIDSAESMAALARLAIEKKSLLSRGGLPVSQRIEVVGVLAHAASPAARAALERVANEAEGEVRDAAARALEGGKQ